MDGLGSRLATARARQALRASGLAFDGPLERASSTRNEIHLNDRYVVRTNTDTTPRLRREAALYPHLPSHEWSPAAVAVGGEPGADYLIVARKAGAPLAHQWPELDNTLRHRAIVGLASYLQALHATPTPPSVPALRRCPQLLDGRAATPVDPTLAAIRRLRGESVVDGGLLDAAESFTADKAHALDGYGDEYLIHGDLTFENLLWAGTSLSAVIDFEWTRGAPADVDLDVLLRCCAFPDLHVGEAHAARTRAADYAEIPGWLAEAYPALFSHPRLADRLLVYAVSFEVHQLVTDPPSGTRRDLDRRHPLNRLAALLGSGGYVAEVLGHAGLAV